MPNTRLFIATALLVLATLLSPTSDAQEFAAVVSPPRFEISVNPGERARQVIEITNASAQPAKYYLRTADWTLSESADLTFTDELGPASCRPWVAIERREITVPSGGRYRFRFEVQPPPDAPAGECRFALMIEGDQQTVQATGGLNIPISGRIAVIVYVSVGGAAPDLQVVGSGIVEVDGRAVPMLEIRNTGNAHGRLNGFLSGTDAAGRTLEFSPSTLPILPGETRVVTLAASTRENEIQQIEFPVTISGMLEWGRAQRVEINQQFAR